MALAGFSFSPFHQCLLCVLMNMFEVGFKSFQFGQFIMCEFCIAKCLVKNFFLRDGSTNNTKHIHSRHSIRLCNTMRSFIRLPSREMVTNRFIIMRMRTKPKLSSQLHRNLLNAYRGKLNFMLLSCTFVQTNFHELLCTGSIDLCHCSLTWVASIYC